MPFSRLALLPCVRYYLKCATTSCTLLPRMRYYPVCAISRKTISLRVLETLSLLSPLSLFWSPVWGPGLASSDHVPLRVFVVVGRDQ